MAVNPRLTPEYSPAVFDNEAFIYQTTNVDIAITSGNGYPGQGGRYTGSGSVYLSPLRVVFVNSTRNTNFRAFELPLAGVSSYNIHQPMVSANYVSGTVLGVPGRGITGEATWKITFREGGATDFYELLNVHVAIQRRGAGMHAQPPPAVVPQHPVGPMYPQSPFGAPNFATLGGAPPVVYGGAGGYRPVYYVYYSGPAAAQARPPHPQPQQRPQQPEKVGQAQQAYVDPNDPTTIYVSAEGAHPANAAPAPQGPNGFGPQAWNNSNSDSRR